MGDKTLSLELKVELYIANPTLKGDEHNVKYEALNMEGQKIDLKPRELEFYRFHDVSIAGYTIWKLKPQYTDFLEYLKKANE